MSSNCLAVYPKHNLLREQKVSQYTQVVIEAQSYVWRDEDERLYWRKRAEKMLREHMRGNKSVLVEAALRAHSGTKNTRLVETRLLTEGFFSKIADGLGKATVAVMKRMPGYKTSRMRNWWIFGGGGADEDKRYKEAYDQAQRLEMTEKARNAIGQYFKAFDEKITQVGNVFPNNEGEGSGAKFKEVIDLVVKAALAVRIYAGDTKVAAVLEDAGITDLPKDAAARDGSGDYVITKEEGNQLIAGLRKRLMYWDRNLEQRYALAMEHVSYKVPTLAEAYGLNEADEDKKPTADDLGKKGKETSTMEYLKSNVLPGFLAALGASSLGLSWLAHQEWFISYFMEMAEAAVPSTYSWEDAPGPPSLERLPGLAGEAWSGGATQYFRNFMNLPFEPGENISNVKLLEMAHTFRAKGLVDIEGHPTESLLSLAVDRDAFQRDWMEHVVGNLSDKNMTLGEALPLSSAWGKAGGTLTLKVAGAMKAVWPKALKIIPGKGAVWALSSTGAALVAAAPWLAAAGAVLLVAGIGSKLMRRYGAKNSRASYISAALKMIDDINLPDQTPPDPAAEDLPQSKVEKAIGNPENLEKAREACANFDDPRLAKVLELLEAIAAGKVVREPPPSQQPLVNLVINGTVNGNVTVEYFTKAIEGTLKNAPKVRREAKEVVAGTGAGDTESGARASQPGDKRLSGVEGSISALCFFETLKDAGYDADKDRDALVSGETAERATAALESGQILPGSSAHRKNFEAKIKSLSAQDFGLSDADLGTSSNESIHRRRLSLVETIYGTSRLLEDAASDASPSPREGHLSDFVKESRKQLKTLLDKKSEDNYLKKLFAHGLASFNESFLGNPAEMLSNGMLEGQIEKIRNILKGSLRPSTPAQTQTGSADDAGASGEESVTVTDTQFDKFVAEVNNIVILLSDEKVEPDVLRKVVEFAKSPAEQDLFKRFASFGLWLVKKGRLTEEYFKKLLQQLGRFDDSLKKENIPDLELNDASDVNNFLNDLENSVAQVTEKLKESRPGSRSPAAPATTHPGGAEESSRPRGDVILERWAILAGINKIETRR